MRPGPALPLAQRGLLGTARIMAPAARHTAIWMTYAQQSNRGTSSLPAEGLDDTNPMDLATLAGAYAMSGRREDAERVLARLQHVSATHYVCPYEIATARGPGTTR